MNQKIVSSLEELAELQKELQKAISAGLNYSFQTKQKNVLDAKTNHIAYGIEKFASILEDEAFQGFDDFEKNYAMVRWYNYQSSRGTEAAFCFALGANKLENQKQKFVDFSLWGRNYDLKTSVYPRAFGQTEEWLDAPVAFADWLYNNQSQEGRKSMFNRIFLVCHNQTGEHWKLKADVFDIYQFLFENKDAIRKTMFWLQVPERKVHTNVICYCR